MIKEYFHIAHLISRHLSGEVTPEESRFLDKWRKESKSHEQLFQKICSDEHYAQHEIRKMEFDSQAGWKGVETRIKRMELRRSKQFTLATEVTAMAVTKLDGTAKGGVVIGISDQFKIPVKYIGLGEGMEDLQVFRKKEFVDSLFGENA